MIQLKLEVRNIYLTLWHRRWLFLCSAATAVLLGAYLVPDQTTKYVATARLEFSDQAAPEEEVDPERQARQIESKSIRAQVAMRLFSLGYPEFRDLFPAPLINELSGDDVVDRIADRVPLNAEWHEESDTLVVRSETGSEALSVDIVNIAAQVYVSHHRGERQSQILRAMSEAAGAIQDIRNDLAALEARLQDLAPESKGYERVVAESRLQTQRLSELQADLEALEYSDKIFAEVSVIEKATRAVARHPMSLTLRISLLIVLGLGLGAAIVFLRESIESGRESIDGLERELGSQILGLIPRFEAKTIKSYIAVDQTGLDEGELDQIACLPAHFAPTEKVSAAFRSLQHRIESQLTRKGYNTLTITSSLLAEGKTIIACNLAVVFAQSGYRTLLIDGGIHRSFLHKIFGVPRSPGLTEVLCGISDLEGVVQSIEAIILGKFGLQNAHLNPGLEALFLLTAGTKTEYPSKLFDHLIFSEILIAARNRYDLILIDGPPVLSVSYASAIAAASDAAILTFQPGRTSAEVLNRSKKRLIQERARVVGIILNEIDLSSPLGATRHSPWIRRPWEEVWSRVKETL